MRLSWKHALAATAAAAVLVFFYAKTNGVDADEHEQFERNLRKIQLLDATVNEDVLKSRLTLLENYDGLAVQMAELKSTARDLARIPAFVTGPARQSVAAKVAQIEELLAAKEELQERFKSQNAILKNSLRYLSTRASEILRALSRDDSGRELRATLNQVLRQVFAFACDATPENSADVQESLSQLSAWRSRNLDHSDSSEVRGLATHIRSIVIREPAVDTLTDDLVAIPIRSTTEAVQTAYYPQFAAAMADAERFRVGLYTLCGLLAAGIGYALLALNLSNRNLEAGVTARTADLSRKNAELEVEIAERQLAEKRLAEQEQRIRAILESEPECVKLVGRDGSLLEMNPAGLRMIEADSLEAVHGKQVCMLLHPEYRAAFEELHEAVFRGESRILQFEIAGLKGTRRWVETHACPLRNTDNEIIAQLAVTRDITERKRSEAELAHERYLLRTLMENCPDQIYFKDLQSRFIRCSAAVVERFQVASADELIGKCDSDFFGDAHAAAALHDEQRIIRTGQPLVGKIEREIWKKNADRNKWVLTTKIPFRDQFGNIVGTLGISKDITAIKEAEVQLEAVNKQLLETSRQAGMAEVATSVLHNVGNVLNSVNVSCSVVSSTVRRSSGEIVGNVANLFREHAADLATFLTKDPRGQKIPEFMGKVAGRLSEEQAMILKELTQLTQHIAHIKEIVAMQQNYGKVSGVKEVARLTDLVEDSLRMNAEALTRHEVKTLRDYADVPPIVVEKHKVLQILVNLIRNAKYACDESGRSDKQVLLRITHGNGHARISVIDNGVGIPRENLTKIFRHGFTTRKDGHGFGLHSSVLAAQELGGRLTAQSDGPGMGAVFTLEIPARVPANN